MSEKLTPPDPPLSDGIVALRPYRADDAPAVTVACQDPEIQRWIPIIPVPYTEADARRFILMTLQAWHDGTGYEFAIVDAATDRFVGSIGLHLGPNPRLHAIGYLVAPEARRRGVASRALRLVTRWGFEHIHIERLALWTLPGNVASQAVAETAGFRFEGLVRNWISDRDDLPADAVMYSMTPEDLADAVAADSTSAGVPIAAVPRELRASGTRTAPFVEVAAIAELKPGSMRRITLAGLDLLVAWTPDGIVVTDDRCPHMAAPLSVGGLDGCVVACPLHEGRFDLCTGETVQMPTTGGLDADGRYHSPWSPSGAEAKPEPPSRKLEARRLTRVNRLRYYPARIRDGHLEAQLPILPE
ncbi:MAG: GNAT family N-acetyltransferase [Candidatus Limnocylindrales bacterium]|jgi:RimJ/RimL family protein N-acetyltransferase/nitrite reductase/ring-hydroxylating ferredoxin subunit